MVTANDYQAWATRNTGYKPQTTQQQKYQSMYPSGSYANSMSNYAKTNPTGTAYGTYSGANWSLPSLAPNTQYQGATQPRPPGGPSGPGGGGGGGGGGGLTSTQQQAMARLLDPTMLGFSPFSYTSAPRDTAIYDEAGRRIRSAQTADEQFAQTNYEDLARMLASQQNVMANPQMTQTPMMEQAYQRLLNNGPGNQRVSDVISAENAYSQNSDNAFANLMAILSSQEARNMQSRDREGLQDRNAILNAIRAQGSGMLGGVEMANLGDARDYNQRMDERNYGIAYGNWQGQLGTDQANVGIQNDWAQYIMDLIPMISDPAVLAQIGV